MIYLLIKLTSSYFIFHLDCHCTSKMMLLVFNTLSFYGIFLLYDFIAFMFVASLHWKKHMIYSNMWYLTSLPLIIHMLPWIHEGFDLKYTFEQIIFFDNVLQTTILIILICIVHLDNGKLLIFFFIMDFSKYFLVSPLVYEDHYYWCFFHVNVFIDVVIFIKLIFCFTYL